ncbi:MAG: cytosine permease [Synergistaceae bacterium]|nr:cytosine permease [Synergistaceae bacterium]
MATEHQELANELLPVPQEKRTWSLYNMIALWVAMDIGIPTYYLASGLMTGGMNLVQAMFTILLANVIISIPIILNGHAGAKYGIPSPVYWRSAFGFSGASVAAVIRAMVAAGWFGIQMWIGGSAINTVLTILIPAWQNFSGGIWVSFVIFWIMNIFVLVKGIGALKILESASAPFLVFWMAFLLIWAYRTAGNTFGPMATAPSSFATTGAFLAFFIPSLTANVGYWGPLTLNCTDFTRYASNQKDSTKSILIGIPSGMIALAMVGSLVTSATVVIFGEAVWDPIALTAKVGSPFFVIGSMLFLMLATLTTNTAANALSPSMDLAYLSGGLLTYKKAVVLLGIISVAIQPWRLLSDLSAYMNLFLIGGSMFLGPIAGICISNYFLISKMDLKVKDLYLRDSRYSYKSLAGRNGPTRNVHAAAAVLLLVLAIAGPASWTGSVCKLGLPVRTVLFAFAAYCAAIAAMLHAKISGGVNPNAMISFTAAVTLPFLGLLFQDLVILYDAAWFVGTIVAIILYWLLMRGAPETE